MVWFLRNRFWKWFYDRFQVEVWEFEDMELLVLDYIIFCIFIIYYDFFEVVDCFKGLLEIGGFLNVDVIFFYMFLLESISVLKVGLVYFVEIFWMFVGCMRKERSQFDDMQFLIVNVYIFVFDQELEMLFWLLLLKRRKIVYNYVDGLGV